MRLFFGSGIPVNLEVSEQGRGYQVTARTIYKSRVAVIESAPDQVRLIGQLTMPRWSQTAEAQSRRQKKRPRFQVDDVIYPVYDDLYVLHHALGHVRGSYEAGEVPLLTTAIQHCKSLHSIMLGLRKANHHELIEQIELEVDNLAEVIGLRAKNEQKIKAVERIVITRQGLDSLMRVNSSALCLRVLTAIGDLLERENQVVDITAIYAVRLQAVRLALVALETQVLILTDYLTQALDNWRTVQLRQRELTANQLEIFARTIESVTVNPFRVTFQHVSREFLDAARYLRSNRVDQAEPLLKTSLASLRLRRLRVQFEALRFRTTRVVHDAKLRAAAPAVAKEVLEDFRPLLQALQVIDTLGMVDYNARIVFSELQAVSTALEAGDCATAAEHFRPALLAI